MGRWGPHSSELRPWVQASHPRASSAWDLPTCRGEAGRGSRWSQRARPCPWAGTSDNPLPWLEPLPAAAACQWPEAPIRGRAWLCPSPQRRVCRGRVEGPRGDVAVFLPEPVFCSVSRLL